jgi:hypothetical protein
MKKWMMSIRMPVGLAVFIVATACNQSESSNAVNYCPAYRFAEYKSVVNEPCKIAIESHEPQISLHLPFRSSSTSTFSSNPPSSGRHFPYWAAYTEYSEPVDRRFYVHNLEHGGVAFLYRCEAADGCPQIVSGLREAMNAIPDDPLCTEAMEGVRVRALLLPDPELDVPVAAAAWGWTYKAECLDVPSLTQFAKEHYGQGSECSCSDGTTYFYVPEE